MDYINGCFCLLSFLITSELLLYIANNMEQETQIESYWKSRIAISILIGFIGGRQTADSTIICIFTIQLIAVLFMTAAMDIKYQMVYDLFHYIAFTINIILILIMGLPPAIGEWAVFALIQFFLFRRFYGSADSIVFSWCGLYLIITGGGLMTCMLHMAASMLLLFLTQIVRKNVGNDGNLIRPVAMIPYIAATFLPFLI